MELNPKAQRLFEKVYPGLITKLQSLGAGGFLEDNPPYRILGSNQTSITAFSVSVQYGFEDGMLVRICDSLELVGERWNSFHHAYHCGPDQANVKPYYFRIDLDEIHSYHVHLKGYFYKVNDPHIPASLIEPSVMNITPYEFLDLVSEFRSTRRLPLRLKEDKK